MKRGRLSTGSSECGLRPGGDAAGNASSSSSKGTAEDLLTNGPKPKSRALKVFNAVPYLVRFASVPEAHYAALFFVIQLKAPDRARNYE